MPNTQKSSKTDKILSAILRHEGGYQNHKADKKGNTNSLGVSVGTNYGISAPVYEKWLGRPPTEQDMRDMPKEVAKEIYRAQYITPVTTQFGIPEDHPAYDQVVDMHVNHSPKAVAAMLQRASGAKVDGVIGPNSRAAIANTKDLNNLLVEQRKAYYEQLMSQNTDLEKYRNGWMKRAESFRH